MEIKKEVQLKANYKVTKCGTEMIAHIVAKETINQYEEQISEKEYLRLVRKSLHAAGENRFKKMRCDLSKK